MITHFLGHRVKISRDVLIESLAGIRLPEMLLRYFLLIAILVSVVGFALSGYFQSPLGYRRNRKSDIIDI